MAKVLLADDDYSLLVMLSAWLRHEDQHVVETAQNGEDAYNLFLSYSFDIAVVDWSMPKLTGLEVCRLIKAKRPDVPVIILTGRDQISDKVEGLDAGADDYLTKPFAAAELSARLRALLRRAVPPAEVESIESGPVRIVMSSRTALSSGQELKLAPREFDLLEFLIRHPGDIFTPEALIARVWSDRDDASVAAVRMAVKRLRSKISEASGVCPLTTIRGSGYKWEE